jgi:hypothetical protein
MKTNKSNPLKSKSEQLKMLLELDRKTNGLFSMETGAFLRWFAKFKRTHWKP